MTTFSILTTGADKIAVSDPNGLTLTLVSVLVVFGCLLVLYGIYSLSGALFGKKAAKNTDVKGETEAAIATALHLYLSEQSHESEIHDSEPGTITIKTSGWPGRGNAMRPKPQK